MKIAKVKPNKSFPIIQYYIVTSQAVNLKCLNFEYWQKTQYISILLHKAITVHKLSTVLQAINFSIHMTVQSITNYITAYCVDSKIDLELFKSIAVIWVSNLYNDMYLDTDIEPV